MDGQWGMGESTNYTVFQNEVNQRRNGMKGSKREKVSFLNAFSFTIILS
jgi:hypothetical protein